MDDVVVRDGTTNIKAAAPSEKKPITERVNHVRVGVKAWDGSAGAEWSGKWGASIGVIWVEIDGDRVPGDVVEAVLEPITGRDFETVTLRFVVGKFETVPAYGAEATA